MLTWKSGAQKNSSNYRIFTKLSRKWEFCFLVSKYLHLFWIFRLPRVGGDPSGGYGKDNVDPRLHEGDRIYGGVLYKGKSGLLSHKYKIKHRMAGVLFLFLSPNTDSNCGPSLYKSAALPTELLRRCFNLLFFEAWALLGLYPDVDQETEAWGNYTSILISGFWSIRPCI